MLKHWRGKPLLAWLLEKLVEHRRIGGIVVVTGHQAPAVEALALSYPGVETVFNPLWSQGLSTSLRLGVERLPEGSPFLVALGDATSRAILSFSPPGPELTGLRPRRLRS